jgi:hypothetical protein
MKLRRTLSLGLGGLACISLLASHAFAQPASKDSQVVSPEKQANTPLVPLSNKDTLDGVRLSKPRLPIPPVPGAYVSPWLIDLIKLLRANLEDQVLVTFIDTAGTFNLDANQIIYLRNLGMSSDVLSILLQHDTELASGLRQIPAAPSASSAIVRVPATPGGTKVSQPTSNSGSSMPAGPRTGTEQTILPRGAEAVAQPGPITAPSAEPSAETKIVESERSSRGQQWSTTASSLPQITSPVRQPYAVQLLDPIVMVRTPYRPSNLIIIEMQP